MALAKAGYVCFFVGLLLLLYGILGGPTAQVALIVVGVAIMALSIVAILRQERPGL